MENRKKKFDQDTLDRGKRRKEEAEKQKAEEARRHQQERTIKISKDWNVINILREPGSSVL